MGVSDLDVVGTTNGCRWETISCCFPKGISVNIGTGKPMAVQGSEKHLHVSKANNFPNSDWKYLLPANPISIAYPMTIAYPISIAYSITIAYSNHGHSSYVNRSQNAEQANANVLKEQSV